MRLDWSHFMPLTRLRLRTWRRRSIINTTRDSGIPISASWSFSGSSTLVGRWMSVAGITEYMNEEATKKRWGRAGAKRNEGGDLPSSSYSY